MTVRFPISRPLSVGDLLDRTFRLYRARFRLFLLTAAVFLAPTAIISGLLTGSFITNYIGALALLTEQPSGPDDGFLGAFLAQMIGFLGAAVVIALLSLAASACVVLALNVQAIEALHGRSLDLWSGIRRGLSRFWSYVGMMILQGLAIIGVTGLALVPLVLLLVVASTMGLMAGAIFDGSSGPESVVGMVGAVILFLCVYLLLVIVVAAPSVYLSARWAVAPAALVAEGLGATDALRRSWRLTEGNVLRVVGYSILLFLINALVLSFPSALIQQILIISMPPSALGLATSISTAISSLFAILSTPFSVSALVLLYYDLRVRREAYDLDLQIDRLEAKWQADASDPAPPILPVAPPAAEPDEDA